MIITKILHTGNAIFLNLMKKQNRTKKLINSEYNDRNWKNMDIKKLELVNHSMYGLKNDDIGLMDKDGKWFKAKYGDYSEQYWKQIRSYLLEYNNDEVVELGCGLGVNLFRLSKDGFTKLQGYDLSKNAIEFATQYNKKINGNLEFDVLDLTDKLPNFSNKIIFTHACLEQVKHSMKTIIQNIIDSKPKLVINFEVDFDNAPFMVKQYCNAMDFQNNLIEELKKNENVEIILIKRLSLNISHVNIMSAIIWRPIVESNNNLK
jgi:SAM-dependent methyltransferase